MTWQWESHEEHVQQPVVPRIEEHTQQSVEPRIDPPIMHSDYTTVRLSHDVVHEIRRVTFIRGAMTVTSRPRWHLLKLPVASMEIHDDEDDEGDILPDWTNPTSSVELHVMGQSSLVKLDVRIPMRRASFVTQVDKSINAYALKVKLGNILAIQPDHDSPIYHEGNSMGIMCRPY